MFGFKVAAQLSGFGLKAAVQLKACKATPARVACGLKAVAHLFSPCSFLQAAHSHAFLERSVGCRLGQRPRLPGKVRVCRFGLCQAGGVAPGPPACLALARGSRAPCGSRAPMSGPGKGLQGPLRLQVLASPAGGLANYSSSSPTVPAPPLNKFSKEASIGPTAAGCMVLPTNLRSSVSVHMESRGR